jgi:hypothetical protein
MTKGERDESQDKFIPRETIAEYMVHDDRLFYCQSYKNFKEEADGELKEENDEEVDEEYEKSLTICSNYRGQMRVNEDGKCIKHGFGHVITTHV